jgi:hypothetical protein
MTSDRFEVRHRIGSEVRMTLGSPIPFAEIGHLAPDMLTKTLRARTYGLAGETPAV